MPNRGAWRNAAARFLRAGMQFCWNWACRQSARGGSCRTGRSCGAALLRLHRARFHFAQRASRIDKTPAEAIIVTVSIEALRASGLSAGIVDAGVSRGLAGISGSTLVVNLAGSRAAVRDGMATLSPLAVQIIGQLSSLEI